MKRETSEAKGAVDGGKNTSRGAIIRLFGVILVILGALDIMLSWRGGFAVAPFHAMLLVGGLLLCLIGAIRRQGAD
ncbi:MAG: hypothetical protein O2967_12890 [Proteobacteria bacterium]|nr:hypothetical protein [Pseudomonadota bacterium]